MSSSLMRSSPRTLSLLAPASLLVLASCSGWISLTTEESARLRVFDHYWQALSDQYPLFGRKQVRWPEIGRQYRAAVPFATRPSEFYHLLAGLLSELGDIHVSLRVPPELLMENGIAVTSLLDAPGFKVMPIGGRLHVVGWPSDGTPAHPLGLPMASKYPEILRIGGFPVVLSLAPVLLAGPPGSPVELHLRWRDGRVTRHVLRRPPTGTKLSTSAFGHLDRRGVAWSQHKTKPFPMLEVATLKSSLSIATLDRALSTHANAKGLILDLRRNLGGSFDLTRKFAGRFLSDSVVLVRVYGKQTAWGGLLTIDPFVRIIWMPRAPRFEPPVVVLTSCLTGSAAEHLARILQRHAGATVIGESTAGAEAGVIHVEGEEGSRLTFSGIRVLDSTGHGLEGQGVIPDRSVPLSLDHVERLGPAAAIDDWRQRLLDTAADVLR